MKKIKLMILAFVFIILDASVTKYIQIFDAVPMLTYAFIMCVALQDDDFLNVAVTGGICGAFCGAIIGNKFELTFIFYSITAIILNYFKGRRITGISRAVILSVLITFITKTILFITEYKAITPHLGYFIIPSIIYNAVAVFLIYLLTKTTIYNSERQSLIIHNI